MKYSCGIIIIHNNNVLGCKPTNKIHPFYDIPKGEMNMDETPIQCAIRETKEETGLNIPKNILKYLGEFDYLPNKKLHLFKCNYNIDDISNLNCVSYYYDEKRLKYFPEVESYKMIPLTELNIFYPQLFKILNNVLNVENSNKKS